MKSPATEPGDLVRRYDALVDGGELAGDPAQRNLAFRFDDLAGRLATRTPARNGGLGWLFRPKPAPPVKGLYIYGAVGRGKTMLMDEFFALAPVAKKRRAHFHEFMAEIHDRIHAARAAEKTGGRPGDAIAEVAAAFAAETDLLCLDEFMVTDIADAMILARLFGELFGRGLVLAATSNTPPDELYRDGLNRALFLPFIALLKQHVEVVALTAATDYRLEKLGRAPVYVTPLGPAARAEMDRAWRALTGTERGRPSAIAIKGREIRVPEAEKGVARFAFADLCEAPLGAADFVRIARAFHTVLIDDIPVIGAEERNVARRFISLVDALYDNRVKLVASAAAEPPLLYRGSDGGEAMAFERTASRLFEMRSAEYLSAPHGAESREASAGV